MVESRIKTTAPGRIVRFTMNLTNFGNVDDQPTLHNHTLYDSGDQFSWQTTPTMGPLLDNWQGSYALLEDFDTEYPVERACVTQIIGEEPPADGCYL